MARRRHSRPHLHSTESRRGKASGGRYAKAASEEEAEEELDDTLREQRGSSEQVVQVMATHEVAASLLSTAKVAASHDVWDRPCGGRPTVATNIGREGASLGLDYPLD